MRKFILTCLLGSLLTACSLFHVHKVEVEQGNIITSAMVDQLHPGMSENQVKTIMGRPILVNIMNSRDVNYVYTLRVGSKPPTEKRVNLMFNHGVLQSIQRDGI